MSLSFEGTILPALCGIMDLPENEEQAKLYKQYEAEKGRNKKAGGCCWDPRAKFEFDTRTKLLLHGEGTVDPTLASALAQTAAVQFAAKCNVPPISIAYLR